jgi:hypothetical protein
MQAEKKVQWQATEGDLAAAKEEVKREEEEGSESDDEEITGGLLVQDLSKLDVAALTPLTPEVIRSVSSQHSATVSSSQMCDEDNDGALPEKALRPLTLETLFPRPHPLLALPSCDPLPWVSLGAKAGKRPSMLEQLDTWRTASRRW